MDKRKRVEESEMGVGLKKSQLLSVVTEMVKNVLKEAYDFDIDPENYKESNDGWVKNLANNGQNMGMTPDEIEYLIRKRIKEMEDYELSKDSPESKREEAERAYDARRADNSFGQRGLTLNQAFWK